MFMGSWGCRRTRRCQAGLVTEPRNAIGRWARLNPFEYMARKAVSYSYNQNMTEFSAG